MWQQLLTRCQNGWSAERWRHRVETPLKTANADLQRQNLELQQRVDALERQLRQSNQLVGGEAVPAVAAAVSP